MYLHKNIKKSISFVLIIALLLSVFSITITATGMQDYDFSSFTEDEAMAFVEQCDINIPPEFVQLDVLPAFTQRLILQIYNNPNVQFCYNSRITQQYAEEVRAAVLSYMNINYVPAVATVASYSLQYNKVMDENGNWVTSGGYYNEKWLEYNCYAYSINRAERPNYYSTENYVQYAPGDMCGEGHFTATTTIEELALLVKNDLLAMGYTNIYLSATIPSITSAQELICVRRYSKIDYHFMHYDIETDAWYHKPGNTAILKYNYTPSNDRIWYTEYSAPGGENYTYDYYDSDIIFIKYDKNQINVNTNATSREYIQANKDVFCELNFANAGTYEIELSSTYAFDYEIYDEDFDVIREGTSSSTDISMSIDAGTYYLRMNFESYASSSYVDISIHAHSYTYRWLSDTQHRKTCDCGETSTAAHVVPQGSFSSPDGYAICLQCRGKAFVGVYYSLSINDLYHSVNGSYILPNGIIVLVEEDIAAYMAGTLEFYYGEKE